MKEYGSLIRDVGIFLGIMLVLSLLLPRQKEAPAVDPMENTIYWSEDGSARINERITQLDPETMTASKLFTFFDDYASEEGTVRWQLNLTASFEKTPEGYVCTDATHSMTSYHSTYAESDAEVTFEDNQAICHLTVGKKYFFITMEKEYFDFTLTCAPDGTVS